jgi:hypothetical protein
VQRRLADDLDASDDGVRLLHFDPLIGRTGLLGRTVLADHLCLREQATGCLGHAEQDEGRVRDGPRDEQSRVFKQLWLRRPVQRCVAKLLAPQRTKRLNGGRVEISEGGIARDRGP